METLGAHKALLMVKFPVTVHYLLSRGKATLAALTHGIGQSIGHVAERKKNIRIRTLRYTQLVKTHKKSYKSYNINHIKSYNKLKQGMQNSYMYNICLNLIS